MVEKQKVNTKSLALLISATLLLFVVSPAFRIGHAAATATPFTKAFLRLDTLTATTYTTARACFQPTATTAINSIMVEFPTTNGTDYVIDSTASDWALNTSNLDTGQTAVTNLPAHPTVSGKDVTITLTSTLTPSTSSLYCLNFAVSAGSGIIKTPSAGATETSQGFIQTNSVGPAVIDQTTYAESPMITSNQVVVNAVVPPSFTFVLSGNTDSFTSNLSTSSIVSTTGENITLTTNAPNGWIVWAKDLNGSGHSGALQSTIASNYKISGSVPAPAAARTFSTGTEDYGMGVTVNTDASGGGTVSVNSDYTGTSNQAGTLDPSQFQPIASSNGTANGDIITEVERATIAGQTPAASDYTDTISFVGAGQF